MVFTSPIFIFLFLPIVLILYFLMGKKSKNTMLLIASLFFYAWGEPKYIFLMITSIIINYCIGIILDRNKECKTKSKVIMQAGVALNIFILIFFKYANFIAENLNLVFKTAGFQYGITIAPMHLPIGISFFTFQAISYIVDVYRNDTSVQKNPLDLALYIALFPQLIAGPIVRYHDIAEQIKNREIKIGKIAEGIRRFIIGFGKKMLIANSLGRVSDEIFSINSNELLASVVWLGIICYMLQIYYDFSGYSDMAIGLGKVFGFEFLENFNYPYISASIKEFWSRWHISLSTWFRDYLYIPLGGSRCSKKRMIKNQIAVFLLSGLWHGASWNFVAWGAYHGMFLSLEKLSFGKRLKTVSKPLQHVYAIIIIMVGWVIFRTETLMAAYDYIKAMLFMSQAKETIYVLSLFISPRIALTIAGAILFSIPISENAKRLYIQSKARFAIIEYISDGAVIVIFIVSILSLASSTYNPFIYFRF